MPSAPAKDDKPKKTMREGAPDFSRMIAEEAAKNEKAKNGADQALDVEMKGTSNDETAELGALADSIDADKAADEALERLTAKDLTEGENINLADQLEMHSPSAEKEREVAKRTLESIKLASKLGPELSKVFAVGKDGKKKSSKEAIDQTFALVKAEIEKAGANIDPSELKKSLADHMLLQSEAYFSMDQVKAGEFRAVADALEIDSMQGKIDSEAGRDLESDINSGKFATREEAMYALERVKDATAKEKSETDDSRERQMLDARATAEFGALSVVIDKKFGLSDNEKMVMDDDDIFGALDALAEGDETRKAS